MQKPLLTKRRLRQIDDTVREAWQLQQAGQFDAAEERYRAVLALKPSHVDALHMLGLIRYSLGDYPEALRFIAAALKSNPSIPEVLSNHGMVLNALQRHQEALASFDRALALQPGYAEVYANRGNALLRLGQLDDALACYERAIALKPGYFAAHYNRGNALLALNRPAEALQSYDDALALNPASLDALNNRGNALLRLGRADEALASYQRAGALAPGQVEAISNEGNALSSLGRVADAVTKFDAALRGAPDFADARYNGAMARLALGDFRAGWADYESRWQVAQFLPQRRPFAAPQWLGREALAGKTILLHGEQGFGDTLQFVRYVPLVAELGARIILEVQAALKPLFADCPGVAQLVAGGESLPAFDLHCPLMSLPHTFGTELATVPAQVPYIAPPADRVARWRDRLTQYARPRIGLVWAGRPTHLNDRNRSIPLDQLRPLLGATPATVFGLQRDLRDGDAAVLRDLAIIPIGADFTDFADTAAAISELDLVISVDTSVVHLAGALGKPVWVLLPFAPDFRWMLGRSDSPWYPTARLFRQPEAGTWAPVIAQVIEKLRAGSLS